MYTGWLNTKKIVPISKQALISKRLTAIGSIPKAGSRDSLFTASAWNSMYKGLNTDNFELQANERERRLTCL